MLMTFLRFMTFIVNYMVKKTITLNQICIFLKFEISPYCIYSEPFFKTHPDKISCYSLNYHLMVTANANKITSFISQPPQHENSCKCGNINTILGSCIHRIPVNVNRRCGEFRGEQIGEI